MRSLTNSQESLTVHKRGAVVIIVCLFVGLALLSSTRLLTKSRAQSGGGMVIRDGPPEHAENAGGLDPTFNLTGEKEIPISPNNGSTTSPHDQANAIAIQSDGKIILAGYARADINSSSSPEQFAIVRLNPDGSQDTGFGTFGIVITQVSPSAFAPNSRAQAVAVQTDGKIVVAGFAAVDSPFLHADFALVRYNGNGSLDTSFGSGGKVTGTFAAIPVSGAAATSMLFQPDGKIVVGGLVQSVSTGNDFGLARYNSDGSLDSTFGSGGKVTTDFGSAAEQCNGLAFQVDQTQLKIVAVGEYAGGSTNHEYALARYNANGTLDSTFGTGGKVVTAVDPSGADASAVAVGTDGTILVAGAGPDFTMARYDMHGTLDPTFGSGGLVVTTMPGGSFPDALAIQPDNKIIISGSWLGCFALVRYGPDGTLDPNFGGPTIGPNTAQICFPPTGADPTHGANAFAMVLEPENKIIVAGESGVGGNQIKFAVARLLNDVASPTPSPTPTPSPSPSPSPSPTATPATIQFSATSYTANEGDGSAMITVNRSGDTSTAVTVGYATSDGTALQRTDYEIADGTLSFAAGETSKTFSVLIVDDVYVEGTEYLNLALSNPTGGAVLGANTTATLNLTDNDGVTPTSNPLDNADARFFVRQHYYDFLSRGPDQSGFDFWSGQITQCGSDQACIRQKRIDVSNAFFYELEYQQTGSYVFRLFRAAFGNNQPFPNPDNSNQTEAKKLPNYDAFSRDRSRVIGSANLAQSQLDLANLFVARPEFTTKYPLSQDGPAFVDAVLATISNDMGVDLTSQRAALITLFNSGGRGAVLYRLADDNTQTDPINNRLFIDEEYNRAFVATQYFGYLKRNADIGGFLFWLGQVNSAPLRDTSKQHAMVCSFLTSAEYQNRFSPVAPHSNSECQ